MNPTQEILINEIHGGTLKLGASQYIGTAEPSQPFDPEKPHDGVTIIKIVGDKENIETWTEENWGEITAESRSEIAVDGGIYVEIRYNNGASIIAKTTDEYIFEGYYDGNDPTTPIGKTEKLTLNLGEYNQIIALATKKI